jgi:transposase
MSYAQHRHDISDHVWSLLDLHLPGRKGAWGDKAQDNRQFINGVFWILRIGAPWRDMPRFMRLEKYASPFFLLAGQRRLGKTVRVPV